MTVAKKPPHPGEATASDCWALAANSGQTPSARPTILVAEVAHASEDHGDAMLVRSRNHLFVTHGAARLDDGRSTRGDRREQAVGKRQEGFGGNSRTLGERRCKA